MSGRFRVPEPVNEPIRGYAPGSGERASLEARIDAMTKERVEAPCVIDGRDVTTGDTFVAKVPHRHDLELADVHAAGREQVQAAIDAALAARHDWSRMPFEHRCSVFLRAADLLAGSWRDTLNAATILNQSKSVQQAEIDAACELIDFLRFNVAFAQQVYEQQPASVAGEWNRTDHRPLEGFVLAVTPFNFTAIAGNLPTAPALMGNTVVWKPSEKQALSAHWLMRLFQAAGLPDGVINLVHGDGAQAVDVATNSPHLAGLHFTGSANVLSGLFRMVGERIDTFRAFPRIVGESGGKDFVVAHPSALIDPLVVALGRGAFEYQGQKCSAASRAYLPRSVWEQVRDPLADLAGSLTMGDVGDDLSTFMGAVIDGNAWRKHRDAIDEARAQGVEVLVGGTPDGTDGWFVPPTVLVSDDPRSRTMTEELFGPILTVHVYDDGAWDDVLTEVDAGAPYALTGAVFSQDLDAIAQATDTLRDAAGNFYVNDKPTGSIVGRQPFGGARRSGTNDKAGSVLNLQRWVSPRVIKETWAAPIDHRYPHQG
ncbi:MAG: L-glutamate gamma-semialdehyde dehydrogenase [Actinobacteria bacterium]|jgi:1-pyrroline-5-carboxylate dehydrogenase|nr:L-glutamate gamma-semialdehyde dehydrogenase [Actinomycetota bacterium]